jgi:hypothetical protein
MRPSRISALLLAVAVFTLAPTSSWSGERAPAAATAEAVLLDAGAEPRRPLRYAFREGTKEVLSLDLSMSMKLSLMGGMPQEMSLPTMTMVMEVENESVSPERNLRYRFRMKKVDVADDPNALPGVVEGMRMGLSGVVGVGGSAVVTPRGVVVDAEFESPPDADPAVAQALGSVRQHVNQMAAPLPVEPVGVGARWKVVMPVEAQGLTVTQTVVYELVEVLGDTVKLDLTLTQKAQRQTMDLPGMPPGTSSELIELSSSGEGTMELNLGKLVPTSVIDLDMDMRAVIRAGAEEAPMGMSLSTKMTTKPLAVTRTSKDGD